MTFVHGFDDRQLATVSTAADLQAAIFDFDLDDALDHACACLRIDRADGTSRLRLAKIAFEAARLNDGDTRDDFEAALEWFSCTARP